MLTTEEKVNNILDRIKVSKKSGLKETPDSDIDELLRIIMNEFPDYIEAVAYRYCKNYSELTWSWIYICRVSGFIPSRVVIVSSKELEVDRNLLNFLLTALYRAGCFVKLDVFFSLCPSCFQVAVPSELMYNMMVERRVRSLPPVWTSTCKDCNCK
jgi:hypothetical protein